MTNPAAAVAVVVASTTDIAVPNAVAAAVAVFAQDLVCTLPSCVSVFGDIMEKCWCRAKGHPVRALLRRQLSCPPHESQSQTQASEGCQTGAVAPQALA